MYRQDRQWADSYATQIIALLKKLTPYLVVVEVACDETDRKYATDFEVKVVGGTIAVRLRRSDCIYRDLTLRVHRDNDKKTEVAKIIEGYASHYLYGWTDEHGVIVEWMLIDLNKLRESGLLEKRRDWIPNKVWDKKSKTFIPDGTYFIAISLKELRDAGCLLAYHFIPKTERNVNRQASLSDGIRRAANRPSYATVKAKLTEQERSILNSPPFEELEEVP